MLKEAGLSAEDVAPKQLMAVGKTLLVLALRKQGVSQVLESKTNGWPAARSRRSAQRVQQRTQLENTVEEVFARMGLKR